MTEETQTTTDETSIEDELNELVPDQVSPYRLASIASDLKGSLVRPQMVYQYVNKGMIEGRKNPLGKWVVDHEVAVQWLVKYLSKNG